MLQPFSIKPTNETIIFIFILIYNHANAQEFTSTYGMKCILEDKIDNKTEANEILSVMDTESDVIEFILNYAQNQSIFYYPEILKKSSSTVNISQIQAKIMGVFYSNIKDQIVLHQKSTFNEFFVIKDSLPKNWVLTSETKEIGKYKCYKAEYHSVLKKKKENGEFYLKPIKTIAWYAPEIPYSTGPLGYGGLPGLILELHNDIFVYYLKEISFNPKEEINIIKPIKGKEVTKDEYSSIYRELYDKKQKDKD